MEPAATPEALSQRGVSNFTPIKTLTSQCNRINWFHCFWLIAVPIFGFSSAVYTPLQTRTAIWAVTYYFVTGYHRLWAHRSYIASTPLRIWLAVVSAGACEDSIVIWTADHRAHHRYTDTDKDPYSVRKGLLYSHMGWLVMKQDPTRRGGVDISDLTADPIVVWQHDHIMELSLFMGYILPCCIGGLGWGDWWGSMVYVGILRVFFVQQASFSVNSLAHWLGEQTFDDKHSPRDHVFTALMSLGEGYHNFHHEFPADYRNAVAWHQYDPTKWLIWGCERVGLAHGLKQFRQNEIDKGRLQQSQKKLDDQQMRLDGEKSKLQWPIPLEQLPVMEWDGFQEQAIRRDLVTVAGVVHDVGDFIASHPGGEALIRSRVGRDATAAFNGGIYNHSNAAHNLLSTMRVAVLRGGCEVEIWKRGEKHSDEVESFVDCA